MVILSIPLVIGLTWWGGTRDYDFLAEPSATQIEIAKARATQELARPADLFGVESPAAEPGMAHKPPKPPPAPKPKAPPIEVGDLDQVPPLNAWRDRKDVPAGSFIELASRLEAEAKLAWARVAWERVLDTSLPNDEELDAALNGVRRIRATIPHDETAAEDAPLLTLRIETPKDRSELTKQAAKLAVETLKQASDHLVRFEPEVVATTGGDTPQLVVSIVAKGSDDPPPSVTRQAPSSVDGLQSGILVAAFKLVASSLAVSDELRPISSPSQGEPPMEALSTRITRLAWREFGDRATAE
ncbi:hypothetical protein HAHE_41700 [Haloferula helveola]|uniref:Uncharacterized protein n=1 Tax=Haloferula helveola TaxID=490095 RepID=A0ABM7RKP8_9BACT|nr:hypothetical protein HAHE_41700 [Haloferula helveola]